MATYEIDDNLRGQRFFHIYNFTGVKSGSRSIYDEHLPNGSGSLVSNRSMSLLLTFFLVLFLFCFSEIPGFCTGTRHRGDWRGRRYFLSCSLFFSFFFFLFNCTILARLSVGTLGFIKLDTILYRSYFDITTRLWGLNCKLHCGNTLNLIAQNATIGFYLFTVL